MALTKTETATIENVIARLKKPNCGCSNGPGTREVVFDANVMGIEAVSRLYLDTWIIGALELLVAEKRDPKLAERLSRV
jgi:hypothetical protein